MARLARPSTDSTTLSATPSNAGDTTPSSSIERAITPDTSVSDVTTANIGVEPDNGEKSSIAPRRVTRASLRKDEGGEETPVGGDERGPVEAELASDLGKMSAGDRQLRARHSIASMETTEAGKEGSVETPVRRTTRHRSGTLLSSKDLGSSEISTRHPGPKGPEEPEEKTRGKKGSAQQESKAKAKADNEKATRRSTRLGILEKTKELAGKASTVLGKRTREAMEKSKDKIKTLDRRASLRPRVVAKGPTTSAPSAEAPAPKKRRVSEGDAPVSKSPELEKPAAVPKPVVKYKRKRWLPHGLYAGQEAPLPPKASKKSRAGREIGTKQRQGLMPPPMYVGARLLERGRDFKLPFYIFSPLPPGQPKPDEWRKANKNVFVGDAASIWKANKHSEMSTCMCIPETGCDEDCQNRYMFYECDDTNCKLGEQLCGNRSFGEMRRRYKAGGKYNIGVEVIKTEDRGYGVRSNRSFDPNQIIVEYTGEIVTQIECERRMRTLYKKNECYYLMYFDQNMIIDATRGSIARFINHSCEPNCRMEKWTVAGKPRMALFAGEGGIMTGEELSYDYNFDPYSQKNVQECRCGAPTCRGVLGPKPKDAQKNKDAKEDKPSPQAQQKKSTTGTKRKSDAVLDESTSRLNKKRKLLKTKSKTVKAGFKKVVSKARIPRKPKPTSKPAASKKNEPDNSKKTKTKASKKPVVKPIAVKKPSTKGRPKVIHPKRTNNKSSETASARTKQRTASTTSDNTNSPAKSKLTMPSKSRVRNSITAARTSTSTPSSMKRFLGTAAGKQSKWEFNVESPKPSTAAADVPKKRGRPPKNKLV